MPNKKNIINNESGEVRVRVCPSPTGALHFGTARTALFNYLFAKKNNGKFIMRVEDTDLERSKLEWTENIINNLKWLGLSWDEGPDVGGAFGPYKQSQRTDIYEKYLQQLLNKDKAYYCFCSQEELEAKRQDQMTRGLAPQYDGKCSRLSKQEIENNIKENKISVIRLRIPSKKIKFDDLIKGEIEFDSSLFGDIIIAKSLKAVLFNFANVIDDFEMKITHVIRGDDHISNTPKHILMQEILGFPTPQYAHMPMILAPDRSKMSKRFGAVSINSYKEQGYLPATMINFMALLGWNPGTLQPNSGQAEKEIFSLHELEKEFSLEKVQKAGAVFNIQKLDNINGYYIREKPIEKLVELCLPYLTEAGFNVKEITNIKLQKIILAYRERLKKLSEITELTDFFFKDKIVFEKELLQWQKMTDAEIKDALLLLASPKPSSEGGCDGIFDRLDPEKGEWNIKKMEEVLFPEILKFNLQKGYPENNKGFVMWPLRVALSGKRASASPFEIAEILGKEKTLQRINDAIELL